MPNERFKQLLGAMPEIAEAINTFDSEAAGLRALDALIQSAEPQGAASPAPTPEPATNLVADQPLADVRDQAITVLVPDVTTPNGEPAKAESAKKPRKTAAKKNFTIVRNLNFAPDGKQPLTEFIDEKRPRTQHEMNLAACYYLQEIMEEVQEVTVGHVLAVYQACSRSAAPRPDVSLRRTASAQGWIDTKDGNDIKVVWSGINFLQSKMPTPDPKKGKK